MDKNDYLLLHVKYFGISYFKVDKEIGWSSWIDGFNYDSKLISLSRRKDNHLIWKGLGFSQLSLGKRNSHPFMIGGWRFIQPSLTIRIIKSIFDGRKLCHFEWRKNFEKKNGINAS